MFLQIRDGSINDLAAILEIENVSFQHPWKEKDLRYEMLENPVSHYLVAMVDNQIVGFIDYWITFDSSTIAQVAVLPLYRRKGIALALLNETIKDLRAKRVLTSSLEVRASNKPAIGLYHRCGFEDIVIKPHYYDNGEDALYMVKEIEF